MPPRIADHSRPRLPRGWSDLLVPLGCYALTTLVVVLGVAFGRAFVRSSPFAPGCAPPTLVDSLTVWDGSWYRQIETDGYSHVPNGASNFAFFPAYPLLARAIAFLTRAAPNPALILASHLALLGALIVFYRYLRLRTGGDETTSQLALVSAVVVPTTFFFRVAYAESLLLLLVALVLLGFERRWHPALLALLVGLGTATRPSGAALLFPLALFLWGPHQDRGGGRMLRLAWLALGCWGIAAFMIFAAVKFHDVLAFVHAQASWHVRTHVPLGEKIVAVLTLGAVRGVYSKSSPFYYEHYLRIGPAAFNLYFANPIYFAGTIVAVAVGAWKRWLNRYEVALAAALVGIPYLAHNYETTMMATGRYMTTVLPTYLVLGHLLRRVPLALAISLLGVAVFLLGAYAALFGMCYWLI